jgi:hypothetical protein
VARIHSCQAVQSRAKIIAASIKGDPRRSSSTRRIVERAYALRCVGSFGDSAWLIRTISEAKYSSASGGGGAVLSRWHIVSMALCASATLMKVFRLATFAAVIFMRVHTRSIELGMANLSLA